MGKALGIREHDQWYQVKIKDIVDKGGRGVLALFDNSLYKALKDSFPEHPWKPWLFPYVSQQEWAEASVRREYLDWLADKLDIKEKNDWYAATIPQVVANVAGSGFLSLYENSLQKALSDVYVDFPWRPWLFKHVAHGFLCSVRNGHGSFPLDNRNELP